MIPDSLFRCDICDLTHGEHCDPPPDILDQARDIVRHGAGAGHADRDPGHVEMERLGRVWGALLGTAPIPARTVALMMVGMKLVRGTKRIEPDDEIDAAGYILLAADCRENE
jgi:hypothetical protein